MQQENKLIIVVVRKFVCIKKLLLELFLKHAMIILATTKTFVFY